MIKVSVIVPVYNTEQYLKKCLDSLIHQTIKEIEIILVNDGSLDNSEGLIHQMQSEYSNLIYVKKENGGLSSARNVGIELAKGEYIGFVDSDDYVDERMFELLYKKAKEHDFDLVMCDFNEVHGESILPYSCHLEHDILTKKMIQAHMVDYYPSAWNKLYKKEIVDQVRFKEGIWFEDVEMGYRMLPKLNSIGVVHEHLYNYVIRKGSITSSIDSRIYHYIDNWNGLLAYYHEQGIYKEYQNEIEYCYVRYLLATFVKACTKYDKEAYHQAVQCAIDEVRKNIPNYKKNIYLLNSGLKGIYLRYFGRLIADMVYLHYHNDGELL